LDYDPLNVSSDKGTEENAILGAKGVLDSGNQVQVFRSEVTRENQDTMEILL
jgi:hypothetical protein